MTSEQLEVIATELRDIKKLLEGIYSAMPSSKKALIIPTPDPLDDGWAGYERKRIEKKKVEKK